MNRHAGAQHSDLYKGLVEVRNPKTLQSKLLHQKQQIKYENVFSFPDLTQMLSYEPAERDFGMSSHLHFIFPYCLTDLEITVI